MPIKSDHFTYEVSFFDVTRYVVDLKGHTCDCRDWVLYGIPCKHAVSAICAQGLNVEDFVHSCYSVDTYNIVCIHCVVPMNGRELCSKTGYIPPLPPNFGKRKRGKPTKRRREGAGEKEKCGNRFLL
ncbi:hypothetical protein ACS0TY_027898 [Phlomoides rotata]